MRHRICSVPILAVLLLAIGGCGESSSPTAPSPREGQNDQYTVVQDQELRFAFDATIVTIEANMLEEGTVLTVVPVDPPEDLPDNVTVVGDPFKIEIEDYTPGNGGFLCNISRKLPPGYRRETVVDFVEFHPDGELEGDIYYANAEEDEERLLSRDDYYIPGAALCAVEITERSGGSTGQFIPILSSIEHWEGISTADLQNWVELPPRRVNLVVVHGLDIGGDLTHLPWGDSYITGNWDTRVKEGYLSTSILSQINACEREDVRVWHFWYDTLRGATFGVGGTGFQLAFQINEKILEKPVEGEGEAEVILMGYSFGAPTSLAAYDLLEQGIVGNNRNPVSSLITLDGVNRGTEAASIVYDLEFSWAKALHLLSPNTRNLCSMYRFNYVLPVLVWRRSDPLNPEIRLERFDSMAGNPGLEAVWTNLESRGTLVHGENYFTLGSREHFLPGVESFLRKFNFQFGLFPFETVDYYHLPGNPYAEDTLMAPGGEYQHDGIVPFYSQQGVAVTGSWPDPILLSSTTADHIQVLTPTDPNDLHVLEELVAERIRHSLFGNEPPPECPCDPRDIDPYAGEDLERTWLHGNLDAGSHMDLWMRPSPTDPGFTPNASAVYSDDIHEGLWFSRQNTSGSWDSYHLPGSSLDQSWWISSCLAWNQDRWYVASIQAQPLIGANQLHIWVSEPTDRPSAQQWTHYTLAPPNADRIALLSDTNGILSLAMNWYKPGGIITTPIPDCLDASSLQLFKAAILPAVSEEDWRCETVHQFTWDYSSRDVALAGTWENPVILTWLKEPDTHYNVVSFSRQGGVWQPGLITEWEYTTADYPGVEVIWGPGGIVAAVGSDFFHGETKPFESGAVNLYRADPSDPSNWRLVFEDRGPNYGQLVYPYDMKAGSMDAAYVDDRYTFGYYVNHVSDRASSSPAYRYLFNCDAEGREWGYGEAAIPEGIAQGHLAIDNPSGTHELWMSHVTWLGTSSGDRVFTRFVRDIP